MLPEFDLLTPTALPDALRLLATWADLLPIAGGTNVVVELRERGYTGCALMDLGRLEELRGIRQENGYIIVGGATTIAELLDSPVIPQHAPPLYQAAQVFANPLVRNRATVAGNLVDASPAADTAPPLLALGAEVELVSLMGIRNVGLEHFVVGVNQTVRRPDELVRAVRWPAPTAHSTGGFAKLGLRKGTACAVVSAAVMIHGDGAGRCRLARIALGAVATRPIRVHAAEAHLCGRPLTDDVIEQAAMEAVAAAQPIDDVRGSAAYRKRMAGVLVRRLLHQAASTLQAGA